MCEILLRVVDKVNLEDAVRNRQASKAGDVIAVQLDGWNWGTDELANPEWRIVKLPGLAESDFNDMLVSDTLEAQGKSTIMRKRRKAVDLSGAFAQSLIASGHVITIPATQHGAFQALKKTKPVINVVVIG